MCSSFALDDSYGMRSINTHAMNGVLAVSLCALVRGDTVELKTGERVEGSFREAGTAGVVIEAAGQAITIPREKVRAIYLGAISKARGSAASTSSQDAIDGLAALRSVTEAGITYGQYAPRVLDAKVKVDRYLGSSSSDQPDIRQAIAVAMREYQLASDAWNSSISNAIFDQVTVGKVLAEDPEISKCPAIQARVQSMIQSAGNGKGRGRLKLDPAVTLALIGEKDAAGPLWVCAAAEVAEAERLLQQR